MPQIRRMKINTRTVVIALVVGGALWYLTTQTKRVDIGSASISRLKLEGANVRINVKIPIINRSDFPVPISAFLGSLLYNGTQIGITTLVAPTNLVGRGVSTPEFTTVVSIASVLTSTPLLGLLNTLAKKYIGVSIPGMSSEEVIDANTLPKTLAALRIRGTLYVGGLGIDIDQSLSV